MAFHISHSENAGLFQWRNFVLVSSCEGLYEPAGRPEVASRLLEPNKTHCERDGIVARDKNCRFVGWVGKTAYHPRDIES